MTLPPIGDCNYCKKPIEYGQGYYTFDLNTGACAAGTGNMAKAHSDCGRQMFYFTEPPKQKPCACRFLQQDEFSPWTTIDECGYHAKMRRAIVAAEKLLRDGGTVPIKGETWKALNEILTRKP